jgi:putative heme-binding domain-containing protein
MVAQTKTQLPVMPIGKYDGVLAKNPTPADPSAVAARIAAVKAALPNAKAEDGRDLTQGICLTCHQLAGKGIGFAPPLDGTWSRDVDGVITAIVDPSAAMENVFRNFRVIRTDGTIAEGFKQNENKQNLMLLMMGGVPQNIPLKAIKSAGYIEGQSMMPDLTGGMTPEQVASIVAYLRSVK